MTANMTPMELLARELAWINLPVGERNRNGRRKARYWMLLSMAERHRHWKRALVFAMQLKHIDTTVLKELMGTRMRRDYRSGKAKAA